ncbi:hypothetical protein AB0K89_07450 [Streptomyces cinnamoneus]|uniref:hypothetical protein n=1 Tax=Streptomyces cinnamoneus TaxID=53446 RepID=UPI003438C7B9
MAELQVHSGNYRIESKHLFLTRGSHDTEHGFPVIARHLLLPPVYQTWTIERVSESLPGQYQINLEIEPDVFLTADGTDLLWAKEGTQEPWTLVAGPLGFVIRSPKDLALSAPISNAQLKLVDPKSPEVGYYHLEHVLF